MLIICNGAFKSGSTWLYELINSILEEKKMKLTDIPTRYSPGRSPAMKISETLLEEFILNEPITKSWYVTKAHFFKNNTLEFNYPEDVKFVFIERDIRDAVVSHYHHLLVYQKLKPSFNLYYKLIGKYKAYEIKLFNDRCKKNFSAQNFFKFEDIKSDTDKAINQLCDIFNLDKLTEDERSKVKEKTSLQALRDRAKKGDNTHYHGAGEENSKLFRKGKVGEYKDVFSKKNLIDINKISEGRFSTLDLIWYKLFFVYRRRIFRL